MNNTELIRKLKDKITSNTKWVIETLLQASKMLNDTDFENKIILQASFYSDIQENEKDNTVSHENLTIQKAKLKKALLSYIDELAEFEEIDIEIIIKPIKYMNNQDAFTQTRVENLKKQLSDLYKLLNEYESNLILENDPKSKMKIERDIDDLKQKIEKVENELRSLEMNMNKADDTKKNQQNLKIPNITELTGQQTETFQFALIKAFPQISALDQFVFMKLDLNLNTISGSSNLKNATFDLITHFQSEGKIKLLIEKAYLAKSGNQYITDFVKSLTN